MSFRLITDEEYDQYAPELKGSGRIIVNDGEKFWFLKSGTNSDTDLNRDLLGYFLAKEVANVAEVRQLSTIEFDKIKQLANLTHEFSPQKHYLIRVGGSYEIDELTWKTAEEAVASELVFSVWTRRRDTHVHNRVYIDGVPLFFDHGVAFLLHNEKHKAHITVFSRENSDYGQPNRWRIKVIEGKMTTSKARSVDCAEHYINDLERFKTELDKMVQLFQTNFNKDLSEQIQKAGFTGEDAEIIKEFLEVNLNNLAVELKVMSKVIYRE